MNIQNPALTPLENPALTPDFMRVAARPGLVAAALGFGRAPVDDWRERSARTTTTPGGLRSERCHWTAKGAVG